MSEYKHSVVRDGAGGRAVTEDPPQNESNAADVGFLSKAISFKDAAIVGVAAVNAKKVFGTGFKAITSQIGNTQLDNTINIVSKGAEYLAIGAISLGALAVNIVGDVASYGIETAVLNHNTEINNEILAFDRGTRKVKGAGGYYG